MAAEQYIWISRWEEFQHYPPDRDRGPAWIKAYTKQLSDDRYRSLTPVQRALLHDLRMEFARAGCRLPVGTAAAPRQTNDSTTTAPRENHGSTTTAQRQLTQRIGYRVTSAQLEALNHAGFIEFLSRESLDLALERFYSSRARDRAHQEEVEVEKEEEQNLKPTVTQPELHNATPTNGSGHGGDEEDLIGKAIAESLQAARRT